MDAHKSERERVRRRAVLDAMEYGIHKQGSLFGLRGFRKASDRTFHSKRHMVSQDGRM